MHPLNILSINIKFEVSKLDKSIDFNEVHFPNIFDISIRLEVFIFGKAIASNDSQL